MTQSKASDHVFALLTSNDELIGCLDWVSDEAWTRTPAEGEWSAAEIVGHVIELERYWAEQALRLAEQPGSEVGRTTDDPDRLAGPMAGAGLSPREARLRLAQSGQDAADLLRRIPEQAWSARGVLRGNETTVAGLVERHLLQHVRQHIEQVLAALGTD